MTGPLKLAVVGAGPSAFYVSSRLLSMSSSPQLRVHMYDRLWSPHGLVRYGVAPDHPEVKNCTHKFDQVAQDSRFRFFGNVNVGKQIPTPRRNIDHALKLSLSSLCRNYTHILFATGCTQPRFSFPFSNRCIPALDMVHWYTQHPALPASWEPPLDACEHVSIIGVGNVALDIARMLLMDPDHLKVYDVPERVLHVLKNSRVKHVDLFARKGPLGAAFTNKELREMMDLPGVAMKPLSSKILATFRDEKLTRQQKRAFDLLTKGSKAPYGSTNKSWSFSFFRSPLALHDRVLEFKDTSQSAVDSQNASHRLSTDLVVQAIGFQGERFEDHDLFDPEAGHLRTAQGRLLSATGDIIKNAYSSGWASSGPRGVLASTMMDAYAVADVILSDWTNDNPPTSLPHLPLLPSTAATPVAMDQIPEEVEMGLCEGLIFSYGDWKKVDLEEVKRGEILGKERERMVWDEAKKVAHQ